MVKILARGELEKMRNENIISSFLALKENVLLQQNDLLQQNKEISKLLSDLTTEFESIVKQNEQLSSKLAVALNTSKILLEACQKTNEKLVDLKRQHYKLEQYLRRECLYITGITSTVDKNDLESFVLRVVNEIGVKTGKKDIVTCHRLRRTH